MLVLGVSFPRQCEVLYTAANVALVGWERGGKTGPERWPGTNAPLHDGGRRHMEWVVAAMLGTMLQGTRR